MYKPYVPDDAVRASKGWNTVNVRDKFERLVGFGSTEKDQFEHVCNLGPQQLINCYGEISLLYDYRNLNVFDFAAMCRECPHCIFPKMFADPEHFGKTFTNMKNIENLEEKLKKENEKRNVFSPYSVFDKIIDLISEKKNAKHCVYFISDGIFTKIGKSRLPIIDRLNALQTGNARKLSVLLLINTDTERDAYNIETSLHCHFHDYRLEGEWFDINEKIKIEEWKKVFS